MGKIYSPSSTLEFQTCPLKWRLRKNGVISTIIGKPTLAAAIGIGFAKGMELYYREGDSEQAQSLGRKTTEDYIKDLLEKGGRILHDSETTYSLIGERAEKGIQKFLSKNRFPSDWEHFVPELTFPNHGNCRADLLCDSSFGPTIIDFKTKVTATDWRISSFLYDMESSFAMHQYVWAARELGLAVDQYATCLVILEPFKVIIEPVLIEENQLERWYKTATYWWSQMEKIEQWEEEGGLEVIPGSTVHRTQYGLCPYTNLCLNHGLDIKMGLETGEYIKLEVI